MRHQLFVMLLGTALLLPTSAQAGRNYERALAKATQIITELGEKVPPVTLMNAKCVSVLTIAKGGFLFGGIGGHGFLTCKRKGTGVWSAPVVLKVGGASVGFQIGGAKVELIMVFTDVRDIEEIARTTPVFSGKVSATAGDLGAGISAGGDPELEGHVITVSRSEGLYAGAVGEALVIDPDEKETAELLGTTRSLEDVLVKGAVPVPAKAKAFVAAVRRWHES